MDRMYKIRVFDGSIDEAAGVDAPVPGLAIIKVLCDCHDGLYGVCHIRSGTALMFSHSPEVFGQLIWNALAEGDWTQSAEDVNRDKTTVDAAIKALVMASPNEVFVGHGADTLEDVPEPTDVLGRLIGRPVRELRRA